MSVAPPSTTRFVAQARSGECWPPGLPPRPPPQAAILPPCPAQAQRSPTRLPPLTFQRKWGPAGVSSPVSHFLSIPSVYFPRAARGKSLFCEKSPGSFSELRIKSNTLAHKALRGPPTSPILASLPSSHTDLLECTRHIPASGPLWMLFPLPSASSPHSCFLGLTDSFTTSGKATQMPQPLN